MIKKRVVKFGGSNLKEIENIDRLMQVLKQYDTKPIMVVSAFYGITNQLIEVLNHAINNQERVVNVIEEIKTLKFNCLNHYIDNDNALVEAKVGVNKLIKELEKYLYGINYIGEIPEYLYDKILSYGERLSAFTLNLIFNYKGLKCKEISPETLGLITTGESVNSSVDFERSNQNAASLFQDNCFYIIPGFYGISPEKKVTLLGRGGTDYSAASIARLIGAESLDIWKDVDGMMSADPKIVDNPVSIKHLSYLEAAELAYFGAKILHPRTVEPLHDVNIPIRLFNIEALNGTLKPLTLINQSKSKTEDIIKSVTSSEDIVLLKLNGPSVGIKPGILAKITSKLNTEGININSVITSQIAINFLLAKKDLKKSENIIRSLNLVSVQEIIPISDISVIAVVGEGILEKPGIGAKIFEALSKNNINVKMSALGGSNVVCYLIVDQNDKQKAISAIHKNFFN